MMYNALGPTGFGMMNPLHALFGGTFAIFLIIAVLWSLVWKGFALWYAARNGQKFWFIAMLILNTLGILEIVYLLFFRADRRWNMPSGETESANVTIVEEVVIDE